MPIYRLTHCTRMVLKGGCMMTREYLKRQKILVKICQNMKIFPCKIPSYENTLNRAIDQ